MKNTYPSGKDGHEVMKTMEAIHIGIQWIDKNVV